MRVLLPLIEQFPYYCPYEVMFASFYNGNVHERTVARCRERLQEAMEEGNLGIRRCVQYATFYHAHV